MNKRKVLESNAIKKKKVGIALLITGLVMPLLVFAAVYLIDLWSCKNSDVSSGASGWCTLGVIVMALPFFLLSPVLTIIGIVEIVSSKRMLKGKTKSANSVTPIKNSVFKEYLRWVFIAVLIAIAAITFIFALSLGNPTVIIIFLASISGLIFMFTHHKS